MPRIVYRKINGRAWDIRFAADDYVLAPGELETQGDKLPSADSLSDPKTQAQLDAEAAAALRKSTDDSELAAAKADATLQNLVNMDPATISAAIDNAFPDPAQRVILKRICRVLIPTARRVFR